MKKTVDCRLLTAIFFLITPEKPHVGFFPFHFYFLSVVDESCANRHHNKLNVEKTDADIRVGANGQEVYLQWLKGKMWR